MGITMTIKNAKNMLAFTMIVTVAFVTAMQTADAAQCPLYNGAPKCYATHSFYPSPNALGEQATYKVFQNVVNNGAVSAPMWGWTTNTIPKLLEIGWQDLAGSTSVAQFYCAIDGTIQGSKWDNPTHNTFYVFQIDDVNQDNTWIMAVGTKYCTHTPGGTSIKLNIVKTGYEITYDNNSISTNEHKDLRVHSSGAWHLWSATYGTHPSDTEFPSRPPMFVNHCDSGSWSRIQVGMLSSPPSGCI